MTKNLRLITRLLAAVLAAVMLSSAVYIAVEANHDCSGEDAPFATAAGLLKICSRASALPMRRDFRRGLVRYAPCRVHSLLRLELVRTFTLISLKVKLSD